MSKALIVSYCGIQDAERLGAFIHPDGTAEPELVDQVLRDLADIHGVTVPWLKKYYTGEYFAWDWLRDPLTMGSCFFPVTVLTLLIRLFQVHLRSLVRVCIPMAMSTARSFNLRLTANYSSLARRPVPVTRTWARCQFSDMTSDQVDRQLGRRCSGQRMARR